MKIKSAKAKGRIFQNWVRDKILEVFGTFGTDDVRTAIMGETGVDIKLSLYALYSFPYKIECKSQKKGFSAIYDAYDQCVKHPGKGEPLVQDYIQLPVQFSAHDYPM